MTLRRTGSARKWWHIGIVSAACLLFGLAMIGLTYLRAPSCDRDNEGALKTGTAWNPVLRCVCTQVRPYVCEWKGVDR